MVEDSGNNLNTMRGISQEMDKNISILEANIADNYLLIRILSRQIELHQSVCVLKERKSYDVIFFIISVDDNCGEWLHD